LEHDIDVHTTLTHQHDGWNGPIGYVQHSLEELAPSAENTVVCLAGMTAMVEGCTEVLKKLGFNDGQILLNF
jgi:NAD(P)H-flavin reductase